MDKWIAVSGYKSLYEVNQNGLVRKLYKHIDPRIKKATFIGKDGYRRVYLWKRNKSEAFLVHTLVGIHFVGKKPKGRIWCYNHKDGNKLNNNYKNIEIVRKSYDLRHAYNLKLRRSGEKHFWAILTAKQVLQIRRDYSRKPELFDVIGRRYGVHRYTISCIVRRLNWKQI